MLQRKISMITVWFRDDNPIIRIILISLYQIYIFLLSRHKELSTGFGEDKTHIIFKSLHQIFVFLGTYPVLPRKSVNRDRNR